jgi:ubiquinone/menaquinone biosynthesis C-methylase UbiE
MTLTTAYADLMRQQIEALELRTGDCVIDLGAGTGAFPYYLNKLGLADRPRLVIEVDFVSDGLRRARSRLPTIHNCSFVEANIDVRERRGAGIPMLSNSAHAVLASLCLGYVSEPRLVLREIRRLLKADGRLVVSSLRRDADMSKLFVEGASELRTRWESEFAVWEFGVDFDRAIRGYMNEASRLLDLEEAGRFSFWERDELRDLLIEEGFREVELRTAFGDPAQAIIAVARNEG